MADPYIGEIISGLSPSLRKELLHELVGSLVREINETERKELLQTALAGHKENRQVIDMVEH